MLSLILFLGKWASTLIFRVTILQPNTNSNTNKQIEDKKGRQQNENYYRKKSLVFQVILPSNFPLFSEINNTQIQMMLYSRALQNPNLV